MHLEVIVQADFKRQRIAVACSRVIIRSRRLGYRKLDGRILNGQWMRIGDVKLVMRLFVGVVIFFPIRHKASQREDVIANGQIAIAAIRVGGLISKIRPGGVAATFSATGIADPQDHNAERCLDPGAKTKL
jgi:hypothetical protein